MAPRILFVFLWASVDALCPRPPAVHACGGRRRANRLAAGREGAAAVRASAPRICATTGRLMLPRAGAEVTWAVPSPRANSLGAAVAAAAFVAAALYDVRLSFFAVPLAALFQRRSAVFDPGASSQATQWLGEPGSVIFQQGEVTVTEVSVQDAIGGSWRCLRTADGAVIQSAARFVDGSVHPGALAGYTRALGLTALAVSPSADSPRVLNLGLGGGSVPCFLAAHCNASVVAVEIDVDVVAATAATMATPALVEVVVGDAMTYVVDEADRSDSDRSDFDVVVVDVYDGRSRPPPELTTPRFASSLASLVIERRGGIAVNLVRTNSLGDGVEGTCARAAVEMVRAFETLGGYAFLTPAADTENAVLWCGFGSDPKTTERAIELARQRADSCGVLFDARDELAGTVRVSSSEVVRQLAALY